MHENLKGLSEERYNAKVYAEQLGEQIYNMEHSRSWRYTKRLRRK